MEILRRLLFCLLLLFCCLPAYEGLSGAFFSASSRPGDLNPFEENGKIGLKNNNGEILIPAQYDALGWSDGSFSVAGNVTGYLINGKWGLINLTNHRVTKAEYEELLGGTAVAIIARKKLPNSVSVRMGCISTSGKVLIPFDYDGVRIVNLRAIVYRKDGARFNYGVVDFSNRIIIPLQFKSIYPLGSLRVAVEAFDGKMAIFSEDGLQKTTFSIDSLSGFHNDLAILYQNQLQGVINREGTTIVEPVYREVTFSENGDVRIRKPDTWSLLGADNALLREFQGDVIEAVGKDRYKVKRAGKFQLAESSLNPVNDDLFSAIGDFHHDRAIVSDGDRKGLITKDGALLAPCRYDEVHDDGEFIRVIQSAAGTSSWTLLDRDAKPLTNRKYSYIGPFNGRFFPAKYKGFWGGIAVDGTEKIACVHDSILQVLGDKVVVKFRKAFGIIDAHENWIITPQSNRLLLVNDERYLEYGSPNIILRTMQGGIIYLTSNRVEVKDDHLFEHLSSGEVLRISMAGVIVERSISHGADEVFPETEGFRAIRKDDRYGFVDSRNRLRVANRYEDVRPFSEGLAPAKIRGKWGFINKEDRIEIQPVYDEVFSFRNGFAIVRQRSLFGLIDRNGKIILPVRYESIEDIDGSCFRIRQNGLCGIADTSGKLILNPKYDTVSRLDNGFVIVVRDGKYGVVSSAGLSTIPMIYDALSYDGYNNQFIALRKASTEVKRLEP